jgi:hypothetical protein
VPDEHRRQLAYQGSEFGSTESIGVETVSHDEPSCELIRRNWARFWNEVGYVQRLAILDAATVT